jgi:hypothetical protein
MSHSTPAGLNPSPPRRQGLLVTALRGLRDAVVAALTDDRPAFAWRQGPDHLYQATRSAFGRPR